MAEPAAHLCPGAEWLQCCLRLGLSERTAGARYAHTGCALTTQRHRLLWREQRHGNAVPKYMLLSYTNWLLTLFVCVRVNLTNAHYFGVFAVIPQSCRFRGHKFECGLSISCVLGGGKPLDLCSGGMIWSCCVDKDIDAEESPHAAPVNNTSE